ncbi:helix-turn-helix domain-containing protein [Acinetobacter soli]|uniref:helix-turn-helix domain-containing protein n=1 Tax=Acinetobacter soli TaxID=487316 RepID=UPI001D17900B|nr:helix-turn-helix domain-containing protein [Acinetobacter soli]
MDELAENLSMSRRIFTRHFYKATSMTFTAWLINERIKVARELLESTSLSIEQISELSGFFNITSFRQHFREKYQVSPNTWRKTFGDTVV